jgi:hypothetical protein
MNAVSLQEVILAVAESQTRLNTPKLGGDRKSAFDAGATCQQQPRGRHSLEDPK